MIAEEINLCVLILTQLLLGFECKFSLDKSSVCTMPGRIVHVKLLRVTDGDTIRVQEKTNPSEEYPVRFAYIDAPEMCQSFGQEARRLLMAKMQSCSTTLHLKMVTERDLYNRKVAVVYIGKENVNLWLVRNGYAWCYAPMKCPKEYKDAQALAKAERKGLWSQSNPQSPWDQRKEKRQKQKEAKAAKAAKAAKTVAKKGRAKRKTPSKKKVTKTKGKTIPRKSSKKSAKSTTKKEKKPAKKRGVKITVPQVKIDQENSGCIVQ